MDNRAAATELQPGEQTIHTSVEPAPVKQPEAGELRKVDSCSLLSGAAVDVGGEVWYPSDLLLASLKQNHWPSILAAPLDCHNILLRDDR